MKITKKREAGYWRLYFDGRRSALCIVKGDPPKYRETQEYDLIHDTEDMHVFTAYSVGAIIGKLETLAAEFSPPG